jgi:hypothetical protein
MRALTIARGKKIEQNARLVQRVLEKYAHKKTARRFYFAREKKMMRSFPRGW